ncbi:putative FCP1 domain, HAD-like domain-containing protein [Lupinus albus]|uniref:Putative FCP1 domain, HAD-like domain-containing protein n=1 Tax=Lupinus albus TaxID=3870 RepID=A0A6A4PS36_LUPAL|nr:putative FCP1 domain, HAD-like domain-containing protein [Lupinus albus]
MDLHMESPTRTSLEGSLASTEVHSLKKRKRVKKKKQGKDVQNKDNGPDFLLDCSSRKTDASVKDPLHESPTLPNLLESQQIVEQNSKKNKRKRKRQKMKHKAMEDNVKNDCCTPNDIISSKISTPVLDMPSEHPIQIVSTDPVIIQSCAERDICLGENEEKDQSMLKTAAENSNRECEFEELRCTSNSVIANADGFAKDSGLEVVKLNVEQDINANTSNPVDENGFVKNGSEEMIHDDYPSPVNFNLEPAIMQDHHEDDSCKFSDGPLSVGLIKKERELSKDQVTSNSTVATEKMKLIISDQKFITASVVDIPEVQLEEANSKHVDHIESTRNHMSLAGDVSELSLVSIKDSLSKISHFSLDSTTTNNSKNKLLIIDLNGLLADFVSYFSKGPEPDLMLQRRKVYKRPFCDDFLEFCFDRFHVGVWSSRAKSNVDKVIELLMGKFASKLLFCWNQSQCTRTEFTTVENTEKPLLLKELSKLWEKVDPSLPWEKGVFNETNTVLLDDSPYKALVNPMHTGIFPYSYRYDDNTDASLGPGGDLRVYLEGLAMAGNVQEYISSNPFGQRPIREANPSWGYYKKVIESVKRRHKARPSSAPSHQVGSELLTD